MGTVREVSATLPFPGGTWLSNRYSRVTFPWMVKMCSISTDDVLSFFRSTKKCPKISVSSSWHLSYHECSTKEKGSRLLVHITSRHSSRETGAPNLAERQGGKLRFRVAFRNRCGALAAKKTVLAFRVKKEVWVTHLSFVQGNNIIRKFSFVWLGKAKAVTSKIFFFYFSGSFVGRLFHWSSASLD